MVIDEAKLVAHWHTLGVDDPNALQQAREQCHHAVQLLGIAGRCMLPADPSDASANLGWLDSKGLLASRPFGGEVQYSAALSLSELTLYLIDQEYEVVQSFALAGQSFAAAYNWLKSAIDTLGLDTGRFSKELPYALPDFGRDEQTPFALQEVEVMQELDDYFYNAAGLLDVVTGAIAVAGDARCWPHHFDLATLITLEANDNPEKAVTIGFGMSPGDEKFNEPYFYCTPWPYPDPEKVELPELAGGGQWHTDGWVGAVLTASSLRQASEAAQQARHTIEFGRSAVDALLLLLTPEETAEEQPAD